MLFDDFALQPAYEHLLERQEMRGFENFIFRKHRKARNTRKHILTRMARMSRIYFNQNLQNTFALVETTSLML